MISLFRDLHPKLFLKVVTTITAFSENICKFFFINTFLIKVLMKMGKLLSNITDVQARGWWFNTQKINRKCNYTEIFKAYFWYICAIGLLMLLVGWGRIYARVVRNLVFAPKTRYSPQKHEKTRFLGFWCLISIPVASELILPEIRIRQCRVPTINLGRETAVPCPLYHSGAAGMILLRIGNW